MPDIAAPVRQQFRKRWELWLSRRLPKSRSVTLNQKRIFILPTGYGVFYGFMAFAIFLGGVNYSNSLLLALSFFLASLFMVTILHTYRNLSGLSISAGAGENAFAGGNACFHVTVSNETKRAYEHIDFTWFGSSTESVSLVNRSQAEIDLFIPARNRGELVPKRMLVESRFPLGLLRAWSWVDLDMACWVYPKPIENECLPEGVLQSDQGEAMIPNGAEDFYGLRPYLKGDPLKHVDWKTLAKGNDLYTKQFVDYADTSTWLDFKQMNVTDPEIKLSFLCHWVIKLSEQRLVFGMRLPGLTIEQGDGPEHKRRCLEALARYGFR